MHSKADSRPLSLSRRGFAVEVIMGNDTSSTWTKIVNIALPILLTALIAVIGFLVTQIMALKDEIADLRVREAEHFGSLSKDLAIRDVTLKNLSSKIDGITITRIREGAVR